MSKPVSVAAIALAAALCACGGTPEPVYPSRPPSTPGEPIADPTPSRIVLHAALTRAALERALEENVPRTDSGTFTMLGSERTFTWKRGNIGLRFDRNRIGLELHIDANVDLPVSSLDVPLDFKIFAEPVISTDYTAKLQSLDVQVSTESRLLKTADAVADVLPKSAAQSKANCAISPTL